MKNFLEMEKSRQTEFKRTSATISEEARRDGIYWSKPRPFCLPTEFAEENLYPPIRAGAIDDFARLGIKWHDGHDGKPSIHLCSSQVQCVNFLYPLGDRPDALISLLRPHYPDIETIMPMEQGGRFLSFEWIGQENYLCEKIRRGGVRTRGANFTSADATVMFDRRDGLRQIVLIEWKYTESYSRTCLARSKSGTSRVKIYRPLLEKPDCPINISRLEGIHDLFYEPFYQLTRQQLLSHEMERAKELEADVVTVLHVAPWNNCRFQRVTSPNLESFGETVTSVWPVLLRDTEKFKSLTTEQLFGRLGNNLPNGLEPWWDYISERYPWLSS